MCVRVRMWGCARVCVCVCKREKEKAVSALRLFLR